MPPANAGTVKQPANPHLELRRARRRARQLEQRRPDDERQHEDFIDIERETDGGNRADHPLHRRQPHGRVGLGCHVRRIIT
jgi:hypothetical protein